MPTAACFVMGKTVALLSVYMALSTVATCTQVVIKWCTLPSVGSSVVQIVSDDEGTWVVVGTRVPCGRK